MPVPNFYTTVIHELTDDPLERGYSIMNDQAVVVDLLSTYRTEIVPTITGNDLAEAIVPSEYNGLTDVQKALLQSFWAIDSIRTTGNVKTQLFSMFGGGTAPRAALIALATKPQSRAAELGLGRVKPGYIGKARSQMGV